MNSKKPNGQGSDGQGQEQGQIQSKTQTQHLLVRAEKLPCEDEPLALTVRATTTVTASSADVDMHEDTQCLGELQPQSLATNATAQQDGPVTGANQSQSHSLSLSEDIPPASRPAHANPTSPILPYMPDADFNRDFETGPILGFSHGFDPVMMAKEPIVTEHGDTVFESTQQPRLCVIVRRNDNLVLRPDESQQSQKFDKFTISIRYWHSRTENEFQWTKAGVFMFYDQFAALFRYIKSMKAYEIRRDAKGEDYGSISAFKIDNIMCTIAHNNVPYGSEMILSRVFRNTPFMAHSMRICGPAYTGLFDLLERSMNHIHEQTGTPFHRGLDLHHVMDC